MSVEIVKTKQPAELASLSPALAAPPPAPPSAPPVDKLGETESTKVKSAKPAAPTKVLHGFNPSARIDSETHIVVLTVQDQEGKEIRQLPNERELAAYKADYKADANKKP
ncbi:MAG: hypothetical protein WCK65_04235 [Rhodospirillaceae bacterium]